MKIIALMENTACRPGYAAEHGLSLYIETKKHRILFDSGQSGAFADNAEKCGLHLENVDIAVLSHGHYDHGGGLQRFLTVNDKAPVYVNEHAFVRFFDTSSGRYIGLDPALADNPRLILTGDTTPIDEHLSLFTCNEKTPAYPVDSAGLTEGTGSRARPDRFLHEQYLQIQEDGRTILFSGCSHKGILNLMTWFQPDVLIGGFHFKNVTLPSEQNNSGCPRLDEAAAVLSQCPTIFYTCHCTGLAQYQYMKKQMGGQLRYLSAGQMICL